MTDLTRQHQTIFGDKMGNCFAACIACMLGVPVADVPNFCGDHWSENGDWMRALLRWLIPRGLGAIMLRPGDWLKEYPGLVVIAGGKGPRGCDHAVLMRDGELLHDPHPDGTGLVTVEEVTMLLWMGAK